MIISGFNFIGEKTINCLLERRFTCKVYIHIRYII